MKRPENKSVISKLREILEFVSIDYALLTEPLDMTPLQFEILMYIYKRSGKISIGDIADQFWLDASTVSRIITRFKEEGVIETVKDEEDKRKRLVFFIRGKDNLPGGEHLAEICQKWAALDEHNRLLYKKMFDSFEESIAGSEEE